MFESAKDDEKQQPEQKTVYDFSACITTIASLFALKTSNNTDGLYDWSFYYR